MKKRSNPANLLANHRRWKVIKTTGWTRFGADEWTQVSHPYLHDTKQERTSTLGLTKVVPRFLQASLDSTCLWTLFVFIDVAQWVFEKGELTW